MILACSPALASALLTQGEQVATFDDLDLDVQIDARIVSALATASFEVEAGPATLHAVLPPDAALAGLRYRQEDDWIEPTPGGAAEHEGALDGDQVLVLALPELAAGPLEIELAWQQLVTAQAGALALSLPLDDGGLNAEAVPVSVAVSADVPAGLATADADGGELTTTATGFELAWQGELAELPSLELGWSEQPGELGLQLLTYRPEVDPFTGETDTGYAVLVLQPGDADGARADQLFTFLLDVSSSMQGDPLAAAVEAGAAWLDALQPEDRFNVLPFSSQPYPWRARAQDAEGSAIDDAVDFLEEQEAAGLSDPGEALVLALELAEDTLAGRGFMGCAGGARQDGAPPTERTAVVGLDGSPVRTASYVVLLTDGGATIGTTETDALLAEVAEANGALDASIFALGLGGADRDLLERLAAEHRGEARFAESLDEVGPAVDELLERLANPLLVRPQLGIEEGTHLAPSSLPDVPQGGELLLAFRYELPGEYEAQLTGVRGQDDLDETWSLTLPERDEELPVVARAWAQLRVEELDAAYDAGEPVYDELYELVSLYGVASEHVSLGFGDADAPASGEAGATADYLDRGAGCGCVSTGLAAGPLALLPLVLLRRRGDLPSGPCSSGPPASPSSS